MLKEEHTEAKSHGLSRQPESLCLDGQGFVSTSVLWPQLPHGTGDPHDRRRGALADHNPALTWRPWLVQVQGWCWRGWCQTRSGSCPGVDCGAEFIGATIKVKWLESATCRSSVLVFQFGLDFCKQLTSCHGHIVSPQNSHVEVLTPNTQNVAALGEGPSRR